MYPQRQTNRGNKPQGTIYWSFRRFSQNHVPCDVLFSMFVVTMSHENNHVGKELFAWMILAFSFLWILAEIFFSCSVWFTLRSIRIRKKFSFLFLFLVGNVPTLRYSFPRSKLLLQNNPPFVIHNFLSL